MLVGNLRLSLMARILGLSLFLPLGMTGQALARPYPPNGPNIPVVTLNEDQSGAADLPLLKEPPPNGWNQQSIWNMKVVGFADNQGRAQGDQEWIENQDGHYILYTGNGGGSALNPTTGRVEPNGTVIYDVTNVTSPKFLYHIPAIGGSPHTFVCGGDTLPHGKKGHFYLLRHQGAGSNSGYGNLGCHPSISADTADYNCGRPQRDAQKLVGMRHGDRVLDRGERIRWLAPKRVGPASQDL